jgi:hypothetical protein
VSIEAHGAGHPFRFLARVATPFYAARVGSADQKKSSEEWPAAAEASLAERACLAALAEPPRRTASDRDAAAPADSDDTDLGLRDRRESAVDRDLAAGDRADERQREIAGLREALATRNLIGQAQGVLIERYGMDADEAFATLVRLSQQSHLKLRDVARRLVDTTVAQKRGIA